MSTCGGRGDVSVAVVTSTLHFMHHSMLSTLSLSIKKVKVENFRLWEENTLRHPITFT